MHDHGLATQTSCVVHPELYVRLVLIWASAFVVKGVLDPGRNSAPVTRTREGMGLLSPARPFRPVEAESSGIPVGILVMHPHPHHHAVGEGLHWRNNLRRVVRGRRLRTLATSDSEPHIRRAVAAFGGQH